jgi:hypothetical protein
VKKPSQSPTAISTIHGYRSGARRRRNDIDRGKPQNISNVAGYGFRTVASTLVTPVIANGKLCVRDQDDLFCYDIKAK